MRVERSELQRLVEEEIAEFFERKKDYPADAMAEWAAVLFSTAKKNGIATEGDQRQEIIGEFEKALNQAGYKIAEQKLELGDDINLKVSKDAMPFTYDLISSIGAKNPDALKGLPLLFKRGAINLDLSTIAGAEDLVATTRTKPVSAPAKPKAAAPAKPKAAAPAKPKAAAPAKPKAAAPGSTTPPAEPDEDPEDQKATDKVPAVAGPGQEEPEEEEAPLKVGDIVRVKKNDISGIKPGDYEVADIYAGTPGSDALNSVLLTAVDGEGGYRDRVSLIVDNPDFFQVNPEEDGLSDEECAELFDIDDPDIKKVLDQARADSTIRGKVASIGRDLSMTMDAVTIGALAVTATGVGTVPGAAVATGAATASVVGSAIAVTMDLLNGQFKQAAIDSIGLIPMGSGAGKAGREVGEVAAKEAAQQAAKSAAEQAGKRALAKGGEKAAAKASASAAKNVQASIQAVVKGAAKAPTAIEGRLVKMMVDKGVDETMAKVLAPMMMKKAQGKLQAKLAENMGGLPSRNDYENEKEYAKATKNYYLQRREQSASIMSRCMKSQDSTAAKTAKKFLDAVHDWVDDVPRWFSAAVKGVMGLFADEDEEAATSPDEEGAPSPRPRFGQAGKRLRPVDQIGPMREQKELNRMKVLAGIK